MKQKKKSKGITIIEAIMSVALIAILIIPLSNVILAALQTNKDGEMKQKASFVGQKILEEMEAYDEVRLVNEGTEKFFKLLDGDKVIKDIAVANKYTGSVTRDYLGNEFRVEVTVEKDSDFSSNSQNAKDGYDIEYKLSKDIATGTLMYISQGVATATFTSDNLVLKVDASKNVNIPSLFTDAQKVTSPLEKGISIQLHSTFDTTLDLIVDSALTSTTDIYIIKDEDCTGNVNVTVAKGNVKVTRYVNLAELYNINVTVYKGNTSETLFQGSTKNNIRFK